MPSTFEIARSALANTLGVSGDWGTLGMRRTRLERASLHAVRDALGVDDVELAARVRSRMVVLDECGIDNWVGVCVGLAPEGISTWENRCSSWVSRSVIFEFLLSLHSAACTLGSRSNDQESLPWKKVSVHAAMAMARWAPIHVLPQPHWVARLGFSDGAVAATMLTQTMPHRTKILAAARDHLIALVLREPHHFCAANPVKMICQADYLGFDVDQFIESTFSDGRLPDDRLSKMTLAGLCLRWQQTGHGVAPVFVGQIKTAVFGRWPSSHVHSFSNFPYFSGRACVECGSVEGGDMAFAEDLATVEVSDYDDLDNDDSPASERF